MFITIKVKVVRGVTVKLDVSREGKFYVTANSFTFAEYDTVEQALLNFNSYN
jgi:hypothetical protein